MASPSNLMDFKSPPASSSKDISGTQSPGSNPFDDIFLKAENTSPFKILDSSFKDLGRPSFVPLEGRPSLVNLDLNTSDFLARESLGILPNSALCTESTSFLALNSKEALDTSILSCRESLGILNISDLNIGRESIGIYNVQNTFPTRKTLEDEIKENINVDLDNFDFDDIENGLQSKKSPLEKETAAPEIILSTSATRDKTNSLSASCLNNAFLFPHSRLLSALSSGSSSVSMNPYFNSRSLEEPSKISAGFSYKDLDTNSSVALPDPFNEAFQVSTTDNFNKHSTSQILQSVSTRNSFESDIENIRKRIQSLPVNLEDNNMLADIDLKSAISNVSFQDEMICRGIEDEKDFDDSVFLEARKVAGIIADTSFDRAEQSFEVKEHNILDSTPQPEWPAELDSSQSIIEDKIKSPKCDKETILKQVDKMLGMQPITLDEKLKLKNPGKTDNTSSENTSQNISKISRTSSNRNVDNQSCASNNFSQNLSKISRISQEGANQSNGSNNFSPNLSKITQTSASASAENASRLIQNLSEILNENENLSQSQKNEGRHMLHCLADLLCDSKGKALASEDSGHSSVEDQHSEEIKNSNENELKVAHGQSSHSGEEVCQALDLSCKGKSSGGEINNRLSMSKSPAPIDLPAPYLVKTPNRITIINASTTSVGSNNSHNSNTNNSRVNQSSASNQSNASGKSGNVSSSSRNSNISQSRISLGAGKLRKSKVGVVATKKGPLRAVLPVETMAKIAKTAPKSIHPQVTPERSSCSSKFGVRSKKTSTPIHEPKLKPMAASTPAIRESKEPKELAVSPLARPKYSRSFSYQSRPSNTLEVSESTLKTRESTTGLTKVNINKPKSSVDTTKPVRRNSVTEGTLPVQNDVEGPMRIKRSFSTGKETKIVSALSRVRQNILNSPYYHPRRSSSASQSAVLTEHNKNGTDLKGCGQELKRLSMIAQPKKPGKENHKS